MKVGLACGDCELILKKQCDVLVCLTDGARFVQPVKLNGNFVSLLGLTRCTKQENEGSKIIQTLK